MWLWIELLKPSVIVHQGIAVLDKVNERKYQTGPRNGYFMVIKRWAKGRNWKWTRASYSLDPLILDSQRGHSPHTAINGSSEVLSKLSKAPPTWTAVLALYLSLSHTSQGLKASCAPRTFRTCNWSMILCRSR